MRFLTMCAQHKLEGPRLKEWIEYHRLVGVEHFFLIDNNDEDDGSESVVAPYEKAGIVTTKKHKGMYNGQQLHLYNEVLKMDPSVWVAFIDIDEFLLPMQKYTIVEMLPEFERYSGLAVNWRIYGTNKYTDNLDYVTKRLTFASKESYGQNTHLKSIVQPKKTAYAVTPHYFNPMDGYYMVNEMHATIRDSRYSFSGDRIVINHYALRSLEDYRKKQQRGRGDGYLPNPYDDNYFAEYDRNDEYNSFMSDIFGDRVIEQCNRKEITML